MTSLIATPSLSSTFDIKLSKLVEDYKKIDSIEKGNLKVFNEGLDNALGERFKFLKGCFIDVLKKLGLWPICLESLCKKWSCHLLPNTDVLFSSSDYTMFRGDIERRTAINIEKHQSNIKESLQGISVNGYNVVIENMNLVNKAIEFIIGNDLTPEALSAHRMDIYMGIMQAIVPTIKISVGEDNWNTSVERNYINCLHAHIEDPVVPFDINSINNEELKAIACFILRGHSFSDLTALLKLNAIEDYRASLVLWGTLCGYYGMNRDSLQLVLSDENYKKVYKKLFGKELGKITNIQIPPMSQASTEEGVFNVEDYKFLLEKFKFNKNNVDEFINAVVSRSKAAKVGIADAINYVCGDKLYKRRTTQCELAKKAYNAYLLKDDKVKFTEYIKENLKTGKAKKETFNYFGFGENKDKKSTESNLFSSMDKPDAVGSEGTTSTKYMREEKVNTSNMTEGSQIELSPNGGTVIQRSILHDEDLCAFISKLDYLSDYQKERILSAVKRVISMHSPGGRCSHETNAEDIISHIGKYCLAKSKTTGDYFCLRGDTNKDIEAVSKVCEELRNRYADK